MAESRPAKRLRSDVADEPSTDYEHSLDFWFADGNVVLVAQKTAFRVHQSVLVRKSVIFQDMFAIPQPEDANIYEGCAVVELSDAAEDIKEVLTVLYDGDSLLNSSAAELSPAVISAWLRLGMKYQLDRLRDETVKKLTERYPATLRHYDDWDTRSDYRYEREWRQQRGDIIVLNLARKFNLHALLPAVFLACSQLDIGQLVVQSKHSGSDSEDLTVLTPLDLRRCLSGRERLHDLYINRHNFNLPVDCQSTVACDMTLKHVKGATWDEGFQEYLQAPLKSFEWLESSDFCPSCIRSFSSLDQEERERMWGELKVVFRLNEVLD
ncbi:hypothetical protein EIP91_005101 [Steccherinum ochraceum]|uniref:BTB domain-containing protein n=1 Tax=Steccherinum ochraceum TaxID=92696 RepID=A0A4R0RAB6_9APHY|nr:hypothetical protein EIP91_005101 [Steccherinum ochraceum]